MVATTSSCGNDHDPPSLAAEMGGLWDETRALVHDHAELFALEARRAGIGLMVLCAMGFAVAIVLVAVWFAILAIAISQALEHNVSFAAAAGTAAVLNLALAAALILCIRREARTLLFTRSLRQLRGPH